MFGPVLKQEEWDVLWNIAGTLMKLNLIASRGHSTRLRYGELVHRGIKLDDPEKED